MTDQIQFENRPPVTIKPRGDILKECRHQQYVVDAERPEVTCGLCDATLDPYWCLRQQAGHYHNMYHRLHRLEELETKWNARENKRRERQMKKRQAPRGATGEPSSKEIG